MWTSIRLDSKKFNTLGNVCGHSERPEFAKFWTRVNQAWVGVSITWSPQIDE